MKFTLSFSADIGLLSDKDIIISGQVKRFNESVIDPKYLLKAERTFFCFDNNLPFSSNMFSYFKVNKSEYVVEFG